MQGKDGTVHLAYFEKRGIGYSFIWDGDTKFIDVCLNGYGEPVHHRIPAPEGDQPADGFQGDYFVGFTDTMQDFKKVCQFHAKQLLKAEEDGLDQSYYMKDKWRVVTWDPWGKKPMPKFWF